jgi:hypothetical protein
MNAWEQAKELYAKKGEGSLERDLFIYAKEHYLFMSPSCIIMARCEETRWFIHLAVGVNHISYFLHIMPVYRPLVAWCRGLRTDVVKHYQTDRLLKLFKL